MAIRGLPNTGPLVAGKARQTVNNTLLRFYRFALRGDGDVAEYGAMIDWASEDSPVRGETVHRRASSGGCPLPD